MATTRQIKGRIATANNISKITKAMEMVAASKMKKAQAKALMAKPYAQALLDSLSELTRAFDPSMHPLLKDNQSGIPIVIFMATNKGLCGSLNTNLTKKLLTLTKQNPNLQVIAVGKKAVLASRSLGLSIYAQFTISENPSISEISPIVKLLVDRFQSSEFSKVFLIYMDFVNTLSQLPALLQILPINSLKKEASETIIDTTKSEYLFEPNHYDILNKLLPFYLENQIFHAYLELLASEHSARMVAMKNASDNAKELVTELKLIYNKSRQQAITNELLEITSATMALQTRSNT